MGIQWLAATQKAQKASTNCVAGGRVSTEVSTTAQLRMEQGAPEKWVPVTRPE